MKAKNINKKIEQIQHHLRLNGNKNFLVTRPFFKRSSLLLLSASLVQSKNKYDSEFLKDVEFADLIVLSFEKSFIDVVFIPSHNFYNIKQYKNLKIPINKIHHIKFDNELNHTYITIINLFFTISDFRNITFKVLNGRKYSFNKSNINNIKNIVDTYKSKYDKATVESYSNSLVIKELMQFKKAHKFPTTYNNMLSASVYYYNKPSVRKESVKERTSKSNNQIQHPGTPLTPQCIISFEKNALLFMSIQKNDISGSYLPLNHNMAIINSHNKYPKIAMNTGDTLILFKINNTINSLIPGSLQENNINNIKTFIKNYSKPTNNIMFHFKVHHLIHKWIKNNKH